MNGSGSEAEFADTLYVAEVPEGKPIDTSYWVTFYSDHTGKWMRTIDGYVRDILEEEEFTWEVNGKGAPTATLKKGGRKLEFERTGDCISVVSTTGVRVELRKSSAVIERRSA